jgi:hypothetical protein
MRWLTLEVAGATVVFVSMQATRSAWSGSIVTVVAARTLWWFLCQKQAVNGAVQSIMILCLPDLFASLWMLQFCLEAAPVVHCILDAAAAIVGTNRFGGNVGRKRKAVDPIVLIDKISHVTDRAWKLAALWKNHIDHAPDIPQRASSIQFWRRAVTTAWHVRAAGGRKGGWVFTQSKYAMSPCLAIARWNVILIGVAIVGIAAPGVLRKTGAFDADNLARRIALMAWIVRFHLFPKRRRSNLFVRT